MVNRSGFRVALALAFAISAVGFAAAPAAAETALTECVGKCGYFEIYDNDTDMQGAACVYKNKFPYALKKITVRPPLMHGYYPAKTKVGWRFIIQRQKVGNTSWKKLKKSSFQTAKANDAIPARAKNGFKKRTWKAPKKVDGYRYRVVIVLKWFKANGKKDGLQKFTIDWYARSRQGGNDIQSEYCIQSF